MSAESSITSPSRNDSSGNGNGNNDGDNNDNSSGKKTDQLTCSKCGTFRAKNLRSLHTHQRYCQKKELIDKLKRENEKTGVTTCICGFESQAGLVHHQISCQQFMNKYTGKGKKRRVKLNRGDKIQMYYKRKWYLGYIVEHCPKANKPNLYKIYFRSDRVSEPKKYDLGRYNYKVIDNKPNFGNWLEQQYQGNLGGHHENKEQEYDENELSDDNGGGASKSKSNSEIDENDDPADPDHERRKEVAEALGLGSGSSSGEQYDDANDSDYVGNINDGQSDSDNRKNKYANRTRNRRNKSNSSRLKSSLSKSNSIERGKNSSGRHSSKSKQRHGDKNGGENGSNSKRHKKHRKRHKQKEREKREKEKEKEKDREKSKTDEQSQMHKEKNKDKEKEKEKDKMKTKEKEKSSKHSSKHKHKNKDRDKDRDREREREKHDRRLKSKTKQKHKRNDASGSTPDISEKQQIAQRHLKLMSKGKKIMAADLAALITPTYTTRTTSGSAKSSLNANSGATENDNENENENVGGNGNKTVVRCKKRSRKASSRDTSVISSSNEASELPLTPLPLPAINKMKNFGLNNININNSNNDYYPSLNNQEGSISLPKFEEDYKNETLNQMSEPPLKKQRTSVINGVNNMDSMNNMNDMNDMNKINVQNMNKLANINNLNDMNSSSNDLSNGKWTLYTITAEEEINRIQTERKTDDVIFGNFFDNFWKVDKNLENRIDCYKDFLKKQEKRLINEFGCDWKEKYANSDSGSGSASGSGSGPGSWSGSYSYSYSGGLSESDDANYDDGDEIGGFNLANSTIAGMGVNGTNKTLLDPIGDQSGTSNVVTTMTRNKSNSNTKDEIL